MHISHLHTWEVKRHLTQTRQWLETNKKINLTNLTKVRNQLGLKYFWFLSHLISCEVCMGLILPNQTNYHYNLNFNYTQMIKGLTQLTWLAKAVKQRVLGLHLYTNSTCSTWGFHLFWCSKVSVGPGPHPVFRICATPAMNSKVMTGLLTQPKGPTVNMNMSYN